MTKRNRKWWYIVAVLFVVSLSATAMIDKHNKEVQRLEAESEMLQARLDSIAAVEQARITEEHRRDSLYANFTSPDLNTFQVKGFVKSITMCLDEEDAFLKQYLYLNFDTIGHLASASINVHLPWGGGNRVMSINIKRKGDYIETMSYNKIYPQDWEDVTTKGYLSFKYNNNRLEKITNNFIDANGADADGFTDAITITKYGENNLPLTISFNSESFAGGPSGYNLSNYTTNLRYEKFDSNGNWIVIHFGGKMSIKQMPEYEGGPASESKSFSKTLSRTITYYTREEIFANESTGN